MPWKQCSLFYRIISLIPCHFPLYFFPPQDVDLTHARLKKVPAVLRRLKKLEVLSLRQNLIVDLEPLSDLTTLKELDLYDNDLKGIHALERLVNLT